MPGFKPALTKERKSELVDYRTKECIKAGYTDMFEPFDDEPYTDKHRGAIFYKFNEDETIYTLAIFSLIVNDNNHNQFKKIELKYEDTLERQLDMIYLLVSILAPFPKIMIRDTFTMGIEYAYDQFTAVKEAKAKENSDGPAT